MAAYLCLIALIFVVINLVVDLLYLPSIRACASGTPGGTPDMRSTASEGRWPGLCPDCPIPPPNSRLCAVTTASPPELGFEGGLHRIACEGRSRFAVWTKSTMALAVPASSPWCAGAAPPAVPWWDCVPTWTRCPWPSTTISPGSRANGLMHGCGHDGHTAMLVGARYLAATRDFDGTAVLVFQPGKKAARAPAS